MSQQTAQQPRPSALGPGVGGARYVALAHGLVFSSVIRREPALEHPIGARCISREGGGARLDPGWVRVAHGLVSASALRREPALGASDRHVCNDITTRVSTVNPVNLGRSYAFLGQSRNSS